MSDSEQPGTGEETIEGLKEKVESLTKALDEQKQYSRQWESRSKANLKELEELKAKMGKLPELEAAQQELESLKSEQAKQEQEKEQERFRAEAAKKFGIEDPGLLRGTTEEELTEHAKQLAEYARAHPAPVVPNRADEPSNTAARSDERAFVKEFFGNGE